jgi:general secretion pathway protein K
MRIHLRQKSRGIALMVVMIAVFVLAVLAGGFAYSMKVETKLAMNAQNETSDIRAALSGIAIASMKLSMSGNCPYSALTQQWAGGSGDECDTNNPLDSSLLDDFSPDGRKVTVKITDLERKFNINAANQTILDAALNGVLGVDAGEAPSIVAAIQDWMDPDEMTVNGAESDYYQSLNPPYYSKNAPIDDLSELLLVRGITQEMYWGQVATNHSAAVFQQKDRYGRVIDQPSYPVGLVDLFTPISSGRINVNTASAEVLRLIGFTEADANDFISRREMAPFHSLAEAKAQAPPNLAPAMDRYCEPNCKSSTFEVEVTVEGSNSRFFAIVARNNPKDIQILSFYWIDQ